MYTADYKRLSFILIHTKKKLHFSLSEDLLVSVIYLIYRDFPKISKFKMALFSKTSKY